MAVSKTPSKASLNKGDYRPAPSTTARTKPIYNAADYRPGFGFGEPSAKGKGGGKKAKAAKKPKIWAPSRRLAPGAVDPWHGAGR